MGRKIKIKRAKRRSIANSIARGAKIWRDKAKEKKKNERNHFWS